MNINDYVFASKWSDEDPNDPWCVGFISEILEDSEDSDDIKVKVDGYNRYWKHCRKITKEEGDKILSIYPGLEGNSSENSSGYMRFENKTYELINETISVGDLFYFAFCNRIEEFKDVNYGNLDPNYLGCLKVRLII